MSFDRGELSIPLARQVFFLSFYFSQGLKEQQKRLFCYIALHRPHWRVQKPIELALKQLHAPVIELADKGFHGPIPPHTIAVEIEEMLKVFRETLDMNTTQRILEIKKEASLLEAFARMWISRDMLYLSQGGRPRSLRKAQNNTRIHNHPRYDAYFSHVCYYILLRHQVHVPVFDELFADLQTLFFEKGSAYTSLMRDHPVSEELTHIIQVYNLHHPQTPVTYQV